MSASSMQQLAGSYPPPFPSTAQSARMSQSQTPGLDTLAEGSQYVLEQLQLSRNATSMVNDSNRTVDRSDQRNGHEGNYSGFKQPPRRDSLSEARSAIRKNSSSNTVRRRISRACDQCNQLRTKCDGQNPCAHCIGNVAYSALFQRGMEFIRPSADLSSQSLAWPASTRGNGRSAARLPRKTWRQQLQPRPPRRLVRVRRKTSNCPRQDSWRTSKHRSQMWALVVMTRTLRPRAIRPLRPTSATRRSPAWSRCQTRSILHSTRNTRSRRTWRACP